VIGWEEGKKKLQKAYSAITKPKCGMTREGRKSIQKLEGEIQVRNRGGIGDACKESVWKYGIGGIVVDDDRNG
jgi:hypothetical protein